MARTSPIFLVAIVAAALAAASSPAALAAPPATGLLGGRVTAAEAPLAAASVYVYQLADGSLQRVDTDPSGRFGIPELPAGLYKVVAFKPGFLPAIVMLTRATAAMRQFVELELAAEVPGPSGGGRDFWSLRGQIPGDVLREITAVRMAAIGTGEPPRDAAPGKAAFQTEMAAIAGVDAIGDQSAHVTGGRVGIRGAVGGLDVSLTGNYRQSASDTPAAEALGGESRLLSLRLANDGSTLVGVSGLTQRTALVDARGVDPIDFERYQVSWSQRLGQHSTSNFAAQYVAENNFYRQSWIDLGGLPAASRTWRVEGSYALSPSDRGTFETGLRYRARESELAVGQGIGVGVLPQESLETWARGGYRLEPAVLVEYGLYTTLADGTVSLQPQGGIVLQLGDRWQAGVSGRQRVYEQGDASSRDFVPMLYAEEEPSESTESVSYRAFLSRTVGENDSFELSARHRELGDTLRVFFSDDVANHLESVFLLPGDHVDEASVRLTHRLTPSVLTTFATTVATGGGGTLPGPVEGSYENAVDYLVTSLDTRFQRTSTGVFVGFHRLEQTLRPMTATGANPPGVRFERLQLQVSQDLGVLVDLASDWAVQLDMELSRGDLPTALVPAADDSVRTQLMGGFSVRF